MEGGVRKLTKTRGIWVNSRKILHKLNPMMKIKQINMLERELGETWGGVMKGPSKGVFYRYYISTSSLWFSFGGGTILSVCSNSNTMPGTLGW